MGCIARIGCLILFAILAVAGWFTRSHWMHRIPGNGPVSSGTSTNEPVWEPLSPQAGERGRKAIEGLNQPSGPVFTNLHANEVASYVFQTMAKTLPTSSDSAEAAVIGDLLYVRAIVPMREVAGSGVLGPLGGLLNDRERLSFAGTFRVLKPGLSEFQIREIKLRDFKVPTAVLPKLVSQITRGPRPEGVAPDALPVTTPRTLGDVRIANRRVTIYRTAPGTAP